jgi:hypothetical protein
MGLNRPLACFPHPVDPHPVLHMLGLHMLGLHCCCHNVHHRSHRGNGLSIVLFPHSLDNSFIRQKNSIVTTQLITASLELKKTLGLLLLPLTTLSYALCLHTLCLHALGLQALGLHALGLQALGLNKLSLPLGL